MVESNNLDFNINLGAPDSENPPPATVQQAERDNVRQPRSMGFLNNAAHQNMCIVHIGFKTAAIVLYFLLGWLADPTVTFIFVTILCVFDFWVTKNLTGR